MSRFHTQKGRERTNKPNVGVRVHVCHVIIQVLEPKNEHHDQLELYRAYRANRVEQTLFSQTLLQQNRSTASLNRNYLRASKEHFEQALRLDNTNEVAKSFMEKVGYNGLFQCCKWSIANVLIVIETATDSS